MGEGSIVVKVGEGGRSAESRGFFIVKGGRLVMITYGGYLNGERGRRGSLGRVLLLYNKKLATKADKRRCD